jgi:hypothetical protein
MIGPARVEQKGAAQMTMMLWAVGLVLLCMMPFATSAAAECAWVLWERTWTDRSRWTWLISSREHWTPVAAVATLQQCERERVEQTRAYGKLAEVLATTDSALDDPFEHTAWVCFPDTMDPRGPRGK